MDFDETRLMCPWCTWDSEASAFLCKATMEYCDESNYAALFWSLRMFRRMNDE